jgi:hypothetical protein
LGMKSTCTLLRDAIPRKYVPMNEENLTWSSGECESCSVDQLVAFVPGKNAVKKLKDHTSDHHNQMYSKLADF